MKITPLSIPDVLLLQPPQFGDERGFFSEVYNKESFKAAGIDYEWVQDNHAMSRSKDTLRGLHFQTPPFAQTKLVRVCRGAILDVAVDIRKGSPMFGRWVSTVLSAKNWHQMLIPKGFAHGYLTLEQETEVIYKVDSYYSAEHERGVNWVDPDLAIEWGERSSHPIVSAKDRALPNLFAIELTFGYENSVR